MIATPQLSPETRDGISLVYHPNDRQAVLGFDAALCRECDVPPPYIFEKIELRMKRALAERHVEIFSVYWKELTGLWETVRARLEQGLDVPERFQFIVTQGAPALGGLHLRPAAGDHDGLTMTIDASAEQIAQW